ncbi:hypothetical protein FHS91_002906 [Sphingobium xanthum]|jgi:hypothetical protein
MLNSVVCRYEHFLTDWYAKWCKVLGFELLVRGLSDILCARPVIVIR